MFDCNNDILDFFNEEVALKQKQQNEMRARRESNRNRLKDGLKKNDNPSLETHVPQGSYAMHTMVNDKDNDYDIDDGAAFIKKNLVGDRGAELSALSSRKMVRDAIDDGSFQIPPEVKTNCVRVHYKSGYHVDIPVYRILDDGSLQLASSDWIGSSPQEVTEWYNDAVIKKSPDSNNGRQMRRVTRDLKFYMKSRDGWKKKMPSGFEISVLVDECYLADVGREDVSLYETLNAVKNRLDFNLEVKHPIRSDMLTDGEDDANTRFLREKLTEAVSQLEVLFEEDCTRLDALKAWNKVFKHTFWKERITEEEKIQKNEDKKEETASLLRNGNAGVALAAGLITVAGVAVAKTLKNTRAYGGKTNW